MNDETVRPALTSEEWERLACETRGEKVALGMDASMATMLVVTARTETGPTLVGTRQLHQAAALALHDQPFGFTREDVETCRGIADQADAFRLNAGAEQWLRSLAARIAALLPPEEP